MIRHVKHFAFEFPEQIVNMCPPMKISYMLVYSVLMVLGNTPFVLAPVLLRTGAFIAYSFVYLVLNIAACIVIAPTIATAVRGKYKIGTFTAICDFGLSQRLLTLIQGVFFMIAIPLLCAYVMRVFELVWIYKDGIDLYYPGLPGGLVKSILASTEEIWRWSMIIVLLKLSRHISRGAWQRTGPRQVFFLFATLISSLAFGYAHVSQYPLEPWTGFFMLSSLGMLMAVFCILTKRLSSAIIAHFLFDFSFFSVNISSVGGKWIVGIITFVCLLTAASLLLPPVRNSVRLRRSM